MGLRHWWRSRSAHEEAEAVEEEQELAFATPEEREIVEDPRGVTADRNAAMLLNEDVPTEPGSSEADLAP